MLETYEEGQVITRDDLVSDYYMPLAEWSHAIIEYVGDNAVEVVYYNYEGEPDTRLTMAKDEFEEMLGWDIERDEVEEPEVDEDYQKMVDDDVFYASDTDEIIEAALSNPFQKKRGPYAIVGGLRHKFAIVRLGGEADEVVEEIMTYRDQAACREAFNAITRR